MQERPATDLQHVTDAEARFQAAIDGLTDADVRCPSLLPGWTVAHVLTHMARNADSHARRADAAGRGEVVDQYPGGPAARAAEIEAGATRSARELIADVATSSAAMLAAWDGAPDRAWPNITRDVSGKERPLRDLPARRWQELEVHLVDLGLGASHRSWPSAFVQRWLPRLRESIADRLPDGIEAPAPGVLDEHDELAWLYSRLERADLPRLEPWG